MNRPGFSPAVATALIAALALAGCATAPTPLRGDYAPLSPADATTAAVGTSVRWGGTIAVVEPRRDSTCLQIVGRDLTSLGRIDGMETRLIGEYEYRHPRVAAEVIYLWPPRQEVDLRWRDPWYYPYPYWYGPRRGWW
jgi:outer membrane lipoprotein